MLVSPADRFAEYGWGSADLTVQVLSALIVEDRAGFAPQLRRVLVGGGVQSQWLAHRDAVDLEPGRFAEFDVILLDALDLDSQQDDTQCSRLKSLDVMEQIARLPESDRPEVIVYSTAMNRPEVNIPVRQARVATAFYPSITMLERAVEIVAGERDGQTDEPVAADWQEIDPRLTPESDLFLAHQLMRTHGPSWRQVWDADAPFDRAAQRWITRNVLGVLALDSGYMVAINAIRKISGLPRLFVTS